MTPPAMAFAPREAAILLWACLAFFAFRVIGQVETVLTAPGWLPDMDSWYSGLLPYPLLLPVQVGILMVMAVVAWNPRVRTGAFSQSSPRAACALRMFAFLYFVVMAVRLAVNIKVNRGDFWSEGAIPVAFHWVLALFVLVAARGPSGMGSLGIPAHQQQEDDETYDVPHGDVPAMAQPLAHGSGLGKQV
jgi:hypothetical protein